MLKARIKALERKMSSKVRKADIIRACLIQASIMYHYGGAGRMDYDIPSIPTREEIEFLNDIYKKLRE